MKQLEYYTTENGKCPYTEWFEKLSPTYQVKVLTRLDRLAEGNKGDWKPLQKSKLSELRLHFGSGYRIYFKELDNIIILIVAGSDKANQKQTIKQANDYYQNYINRSEQNDN